MNQPEWRISDGAVPYAEALAVMEGRVADIHAGRERELVWLLEHPPLYTAGTSAKPHDLLQPMRFPVHVAGRGGQYTYHGPGQRVVYAMLDLRARRQDVRRFVFDLEEWTLRALARFSITAERRTGRVGVWVARPDKPPLPDGSAREDKIAAVGVRIRHWVSFHGLSINVESRPAGQPGRSRYCAGRDVRRGVRRGRQAVGSCVKRSGRPVASADWTSTLSTRPCDGPRRQASIIAETAASSPAISTSTDPSVRLRTQPRRPRVRAVLIAQSR